MYIVQGNEYSFIGEIYNVKQSQKTQNCWSGSIRITNTGNAQNDYTNVIDYTNLLQNNHINTNDVVVIFGYINKVGVHIIQAVQKIGNIVHKQQGNNYQQQGNYPQQQGNNYQQQGNYPQQQGNNYQQQGNNYQQQGNYPQQQGNNYQQQGNYPQQQGNNYQYRNGNRY